MNIIHELWNGNINPTEERLFDTPTFKELTAYMARHRDELEITLTDKQKELLEKYSDCRNEFDSNAELTVFEYGFKLGARLKLEHLEGNRRIEGEIYAGVILIAADDGHGGTTDLTDEQVAKYSQMFATPEVISDEEVARSLRFEFYTLS